MLLREVIMVFNSLEKKRLRDVTILDVIDTLNSNATLLQES